ncbi:hypothetical protein BGW80DRAFT_1565195, partial [Lactifluus volemus]
MQMDGHSIGSNNENVVVRHCKISGRDVGSVFRQITILSLPDNVLLDIFEFCINEYSSLLTWVWKTLVHVCRRWRYMIFGSPIRLNLRLRCTGRTPVKKSLN